jgi:hypothetical protein
MELQVCLEKMDDAQIFYGELEPYDCITHHLGFQQNCLLWEVLDNEWKAYKQQYGAHSYESNSIHKRRRHVAYRQLARFLFGIVGRSNRYILPACAVSKIRETFPNENVQDVYTGFLYGD